MLTLPPCVGSYVPNSSVSSLWTYLFTMSKVPELMDTVFIVLRKQPLIFLHWYHHITVLIFTWFRSVGHSRLRSGQVRWFGRRSDQLAQMMCRADVVEGYG